MPENVQTCTILVVPYPSSGAGGAHGVLATSKMPHTEKLNRTEDARFKADLATGALPPMGPRGSPNTPRTYQLMIAVAETVNSVRTLTLTES